MEMRARHPSASDHHHDAPQLHESSSGAALISLPAQDGGQSGEQSHHHHRPGWKSRTDFLLTILSYAVGLGNIWRFPYLAYKNGGGAFLVPFVIMLVLTGLPLVFLELSFGQMGGQGVIPIWAVCPLFQGIGVGMFFVSTFIASYYNVIVSWALYYTVQSFTANLPWMDCNNKWNTPACESSLTLAQTNCTSREEGILVNGTCYLQNVTNASLWQLLSGQRNKTSRMSPSDEFFHRRVLDMSAGLDDVGAPRWELVLSLLVCWVLVVLCLIKGVQSLGKVAHFTALFPYVVLLILLGRAVTLDGSVQGILYYVVPDFHRLVHPKVWCDAAVQVFFSLSPCWGGLITLSSYNKYRHNCLRDALFVTFADALTSILAGFVVFSIVGAMAHQLSQPVEAVARDGAGLAFVLYPELVTHLPIPPLWSVLFFVMLLTIGFGTQISTVNTLLTCLNDMLPPWRAKRICLLVAISCLCFLVGLSCTTRGGIFVLQLFDDYAATYSLLILGLAECLVLSWVYKGDRFLDHIEEMLDKRPSVVWKYLWRFITPSLLAAVLISTWVDFVPSSYGEYTFPAWATAVGWIMCSVSVLPIPVVFGWKLFTGREKEETLLQAMKRLLRPDGEWRMNYLRYKQHYSEFNELQLMDNSEEPELDPPS